MRPGGDLFSPNDSAAAPGDGSIRKNPNKMKTKSFSR